MVFGQEARDSIELRKAWWGYKVPRYQGKKISSFHPYRDFGNIMQYDPEATKFLRRGKRFQIAGLVIESVGVAALVFWETNKLPVNSTTYVPIDPSIFPLAIAIGLVTSPFIVQSGKNNMKAINTYNGNLHKTGLRSIKPEYYFTIKGSSFGLAVKF